MTAELKDLKSAQIEKASKRQSFKKSGTPQIGRTLLAAMRRPFGAKPVCLRHKTKERTRHFCVDDVHLANTMIADVDPLGRGYCDWRAIVRCHP
jgi:hypothetical protein